MLIDADKFPGCPVLSLHVGGKIAEVTGLIVDPHQLKVVGFQLMGPELGGENGTILQTKDIREFSELGMVIDSIDELVNPGEVIKLDKILDLDFDLNGKKVVSKKGSRIGKVINYTINSANFMVQQFLVQRPMMKSFLDPELLIGRSEVVKVDDEKVVVKDEADKIRKKGMREDFVPNFVNPFRETRLAAESKLIKNAKATKSTRCLKPNPSTTDNQTLDGSDTE